MKMMDIGKKFEAASRRSALARVAMALGLALLPLAARAQATTQVTPRQWPVFSSITLSNQQTVTGSYAANLGYIAVAAATNTFMPFSGSHAIGLQAQIVNTNKFAAASNLVVTVYPAYDTSGGPGSSLNIRYGTNFSATPLLVWTITFTTNQTASTNLPTALWEPATALGYNITTGFGTATTGGAVSNIQFSLTEVVAP